MRSQQSHLLGAWYVGAAASRNAWWETARRVARIKDAIAYLAVLLGEARTRHFMQMQRFLLELCAYLLQQPAQVIGAAAALAIAPVGVAHVLDKLRIARG